MLTVLWETSSISGSDIVLSTAGRRGRYITTSCPSESRWYEQFTLGTSIRMGDIVSQDKAYTIEVLHELLNEYEQEWVTNDLGIELEVISACMFLLVSSLGGMQGFEVMWTDLAALRYDLNFAKSRETSPPCPGRSWTVSRTKMESSRAT
jgi:hypothetical protein